MSIPLEFSESQKELIHIALGNRTKSIVLEKERMIIEEIQLKIGSKFDNYYDRRHKLKIITCLKEILDDHRKTIDISRHSHLLDFLTISDQNLEKIQIIDDYKDLFKVLRKEPTFRFRNIFNSLEMLKASQEILISGSDRTGYNKIAFLDKDSICVLEPRDELKFDHLFFKRDTKNSLLELKTRFSLSFNRADAFEFVNRPEFKFQNDKLTMFFRLILG